MNEKERVIFCKDVYHKRDEIRFGRETVYTWISITITLVASLVVGWDIFKIAAAGYHQRSLLKVFEQCVFLGIVSFLIYGNLLYQLTRLFYFKRLLGHDPTPSKFLDEIYDSESPPSLTILIPSFKEEPRVIRQALLSSALQTYPKRRVVLLIDDPPNPTRQDDWEKLVAARHLPREVQSLFKDQVARRQQALMDFMERQKMGALDLEGENFLLAQAYQEVSDWFLREAGAYPILDHTDRLFVQITLQERSEKYLHLAQQIRGGIQKQNFFVPEERLEREYRRLACLFDVELSSFERKQNENLPHEPNKAMNLNSYIGLLGKHFVETDYKDSVYLVETSQEEGSLQFPDTDYLITLDADRGGGAVASHIIPLGSRRNSHIKVNLAYNLPN